MTVKKRRLSLEFGTPDATDRTSRTVQRIKRGEKLVARVNLNTNRIMLRNHTSQEIIPDKIKNIHTISIAAHGDKFGMNFIGDGNEKMSSDDLVSKIENMFPHKKDLPKEIILNCCYSKGYIASLRSLIKSKKLPIEKITYHQYQDINGKFTDGIIYPKHHKSYCVKTPDQTEHDSMLVTVTVQSDI